MTFTFNDTDRAVQERLNSWGIKYTAYYLGAHTDKAEDDRKAWEHDLFTVVFTPNDGKKPIAQFSYKTGTGHRLSADTYQAKSKELLKSGVHLKAHAELSGLEKTRFPIEINRGRIAAWVPAPVAAGVLYSILLDASALDTNPEDWLSDLGYDADSIRANEIYRACCESGRKLRTTFTRSQLDELQELLQDY